MDDGGFNGELREVANRMNAAGSNGHRLASSQGQQLQDRTSKKQKNVRAIKQPKQETGDSLLAFLIGFICAGLTVALILLGIAGRIERIYWGIGSVVLCIVELVASKKSGKSIFQTFALINLIGLIIIIAMILKDKAVFDWVQKYGQGGLFNE